MRSVLTKLTLILAIALAIALTGCSKDTPLEPTTGANLNTTSPLFAATGDPVIFDARVATTTPATRTLTFIGTSEVVVAADDCEIFKMEYGIEIPILFTDIAVNDSVHICGVRQDDGTVLANRIHVFGVCNDEDPDPCDVSFRDTITSIDYVAGTFTVAGRTEVIHVDENTIIWGTFPAKVPGSLDEIGYLTDDGAAVLKGRADYGYHTQAADTFYLFTDLKVGSVVDVGADIIDANTLLARAIKLIVCVEVAVSEEFTATLATVDCDNRLVTFTGLSWIGQVCPGAELFDANGDPITFCDFAAGDQVMVKAIRWTSTLSSSL